MGSSLNQITLLEPRTKLRYWHTLTSYTFEPRGNCKNPEPWKMPRVAAIKPSGRNSEGRIQGLNSMLFEGSCLLS